MVMNGAVGNGCISRGAGGCPGMAYSTSGGFGHPSRSLSVPEGLSVVSNSSGTMAASKCGCEYQWQAQLQQQQQQRCRSITDLMVHPNASFNNPRAQLVEQITTSV